MANNRRPKRRSPKKGKRTTKGSPVASRPASHEPALRGLAEDGAWRYWWVVFALLVPCVLVIYWPTLDHHFLRFDDRAYIYENPLVVGGQSFWAIWGQAGAELPKKVVYPVTTSTFWLEHAWVGLSPAGVEGLTEHLNQPAHPLYHITQIVLHVANTGAMLWVLRLLGVGFLPAAATVLIYAVHPMNVESVAWLAERKNTVSGLFFWLSLALYITYRRYEAANPTASVGARYWRYGMSIVLYLAALGGKISAISLAPLIVVTDRLLDGRWAPKSLLRSGPYFVLGVIVSKMVLGRAQDIANVVEPIEAIFRPLFASGAIVRYVLNTVWPVDNVLIYPKWEIPTDGRFWLCALVVGLAIVWFRRYGRRLDDLAAWGIGLFLVAIAPASGLVDFTWMAFSGIADHFMYLGLAGVVLALMVVLDRVRRGLPPLAARSDRPVASTSARRTVTFAAVGTAIVVALTGLSAQYARVWVDDFSLWNHTLTVNTDSWMANYNLGNHHMRFDDCDRALEYWRECMRIAPTKTNPYTSGARCFDSLNRGTEAVTLLDEAIAARTPLGLNVAPLERQRTELAKKYGLL